VAACLGALCPIPPEAPRGDVRVGALGIACLKARGDERDEVRAIHVRMVVDNKDDGPWLVDTREQVGVLEGAGKSRPAFASASTGLPPLVWIGAGASEALDLYYPMPAAMQSASAVDRFEVASRVHTRLRIVLTRASFEHVRRETIRSEDDVAEGFWGPAPWGPGWYDTAWPRAGFEGALVLPPAYAREPVFAAAPPQMRIP
jgi:hypothetical protein